MRLLKITACYPGYLKDFYDRHAGAQGKSYAEQKAALDYDAFGWGDFWSQALSPRGYEVMEVTANIQPLQRAWAREHGVQFHPDTWLWDIPWEQVKKFQPTVLFMDEYSTFSYEWLAELRRACPAISLILGWCGAPYHDPTVFKAYDVVLSCIPEMVEHFRAGGHISYQVNHAFEPRVLDRLAATSQDINFSFIGSIIRGKDGHQAREELLLNLVGQVPIQIFSPNQDLTRKDELQTLARGMLYQVMRGLQGAGFSQPALAKLPLIGKAAGWPYRPLRAVHPRLQKVMKPAVFGLKMYQTLRKSKITFNSHIDASVDSASNMRLFEATGVGTCLVTDWKKNLAQLFEPEKEVATYRSPAECVEKVKWLLDHPQERQAMGQAGQARTLRDHTFSLRALHLDDIIKSEIKKI